MFCGQALDHNWIPLTASTTSLVPTSCWSFVFACRVWGWCGGVECNCKAAVNVVVECCGVGRLKIRNKLQRAKQSGERSARLLGVVTQLKGKVAGCL